MRQQDVFLLPDGRHGCGRGLQLVAKNNGKSRSWILRLSHGGRRYEFSLGAAKTLSLKAAVDIQIVPVADEAQHFSEHRSVADVLC